MTDWRGLCAELVDELVAWEQANDQFSDGGTIRADADYQLAPRARAALAQPEPEGPKDEELLSLDQLRDAWNAHADAANGWDELGVDEIVWWAQRQALAGWGRLTPQPAAADLAARPLLERVARMGDRIGQHTVGEIITISDRARAWLEANPPGQPVAIEPRGCPAPGACGCVEPAPQPVADGEVGELAAKLRRLAPQNPLGIADPTILRAADLLERQHPQPIPVSERLPGPGDCDAEGRCWLCGKVEGDWRLINPERSGVPRLRYCFSHWLPAHALPMPALEAER